MHQQVALVPDAGRVVPRGQPEAADVVHAGLHQPVDVFLRRDQAWLETGDGTEVSGGQQQGSGTIMNQTRTLGPNMSTQIISHQLVPIYFHFYNYKVTLVIENSFTSQ